MVVSLFHTVFDMLAFKNDIGFWKNNKVSAVLLLSNSHASEQKVLHTLSHGA